MNPSVNNDQQMLHYISLLLDIIETQDWETFESVALSNPKAFQIISRRIANCPEFNGMTLLHACVRYDPPLHIVSQMIRLCPEMTEAQDCLKRTPLHVAAGTGASASMVKLLAKACPKSCDVQDEDGRTPLHFACDSSSELFDDQNDEPRGPPSYEVVRALLSESLHAATLEDEDGMSALEYAITSDGSIKVVNLLQKATQKQIKKQCSFGSRIGQQQNLVGAISA